MSDDKRKLLIVEDDKGLQRQLRWSFDQYDVTIAGDRSEAIAAVKSESPAVVTVDLGLPPDPDGASEGLATLEDILNIAPTTKVIIVTGNEAREHALRSVAAGAYDFYQKPIDAEELGLIIERAFRLWDIEQENRELTEAQGQMPLRGVMTASDKMMGVCRIVEKVAPSNVTVLLLGESGTGKELLARALHELSPRGKGQFVAINCAAIPENLLESELFGHEKGAFTGAVAQTKGKIETAHGGTLFLDEIGDVPLALQVKLLRFLQERVIERIGGRKEIPVDLRVVCATHRNLSELIAQGAFREDLYYRLTELVIEIPPLRARDEDPLLLARHFVNLYARENGRSIRGLTGEASSAVITHEWPGNVRELENRVKRAVIMADGKNITASDLDLVDNEEEPTVLNIKQAREIAERRALQRALALTDGNITKSAKLLGVSRPTLYDLIKQHNMEIASLQGGGGRTAK